MTKLILFSSGLDSTFLVYKALTEGHTVHVVYTEIVNNKYKSKIEKQNIKKLISLFREEFGNDNLIDINENSKNDYLYQSILLLDSNSFNLKQALVHLTTISQNLYYDNNNFFDEIQIGYIMNDCAVSYIDEFKKAYKSLCFFTYTENKKYPSLKFPLLKLTKQDIANSLPKKYFDLVWTCENPIYIDGNMKMCDECEPCKRTIACNIYDKFTKSFIIEEIL